MGVEEAWRENGKWRGSISIKILKCYWSISKFTDSFLCHHHSVNLLLWTLCLLVLFWLLLVLDLESPFVSFLSFLFLAGILYCFIYPEQISPYIMEHSYNSYFKNPCLQIPTSGSYWTQLPMDCFFFWEWVTFSYLCAFQVIFGLYPKCFECYGDSGFYSISHSLPHPHHRVLILFKFVLGGN